MAHGPERAAAVEVREYRPGEERLLFGLLDEALRGGARSYGEALWRWKHLDNPFGVSRGRYAWDPTAGRAAALRILMRWCFRLPGGSEIAAVRAVDTATGAEYRRGGLFRRLTREVVGDLEAEGCALIFNTPNRASLPGYLAMGWERVARWPVSVLPLRPLRCAAGLAGVARDDGGAGTWSDCFGLEVQPWRRFASDHEGGIDPLVQEAEGTRPAAGLRTPRDARYLAWRYGGHPTARYGAVAVEQGGRLSGIAVLRANRRFGLREAALVELFVAPWSAGAGRTLLRRVREALRADYCVAAFAPGTAEARLLREAGFIRVPGRGIVLAARALHRIPVDPARAGSWDLALGDLEVF